jgi:hypothetical protein
MIRRSRRKLLETFGLCLSALAFVQRHAAAQPAPSPEKEEELRRKRKPDLGDMAQGQYRGEIVSDSRGTSSDAPSSVMVTIERIGVNRVRVTTSTPQLPGLETRLTSAMGRVMNADGNSTLLLDPTQRPTSIHYTWEQVVAFVGTRE